MTDENKKNIFLSRRRRRVLSPKQRKALEGLRPHEQQALKKFWELERAAKAAKGKAAKAGRQVVPRIALDTQVDYSKADPACAQCGGSGVQRYEAVATPEGMTESEMQENFHALPDRPGEYGIPVVCACVVKAGGVDGQNFEDVLQSAQDIPDESVKVDETVKH